MRPPRDVPPRPTDNGSVQAIASRAAVLGVEQVLERPPSQSDLLNFVAGAIG